MEHISSVDESNAVFWDELCGTLFARQLGITEVSKESLAVFDDHYLKFYPYLETFIPFSRLADKQVLEVGLGFGTVSQKIAEAGAEYSGLDIANGPVDMVGRRLQWNGYRGSAQRGSILKAPFPDARFDSVIAIGCYHHTGDLQSALDETWRVLKPGGTGHLMVYNAYSYRRWLWWPAATFDYLLWDKFGRKVRSATSAAERSAYDSSSEGVPAPETVFVSRGRLRKMTQRFARFDARLENIGAELLLRLIPRNLLLCTLGPLVGLDIYLTLEK